MHYAWVVNILAWMGIGLTVLLILFIFHEELWVIRDAEVIISRGGIEIYDARYPKSSRGLWLGMPLGNAVDGVYEFLERCVPLKEYEREPMKKVQIIFRRAPPTTLFGYDRGLSGYYLAVRQKIHIDDLLVLSHELIHHYLHQRASRSASGTFAKIRLFFLGSGNHHEKYRSLFERCDNFSAGAAI